MKNHNKILEAINRGIQLALDDFNDDYQVLNIKSKQVLNRDYTKEYLDLMEEVADLGLPSKTLWCKYNLGVDINNITSSNQLIGDYYAWGELKPNKPEFSWSTYKYAEHYTDLHETECLTKYCNNPQKGYNQITKTWGFTDNLILLLPEDDAAYQNKKLYNFKFSIPTIELFNELIKYTTTENIYAYINHSKLEFSKHIEYDNKYNIYGILLTSKINGNQIFFPFGSYKDDANKNSFDSGHYWTANLYLNYPAESYCMWCGSDFIRIYIGKRYRGLNIRPVINL